MKHFRCAILTLGLITLSACQTLDGVVKDIDALALPSLGMNESSPEALTNNIHCPTIEIVEELRHLSEFTDITDPNEQTLITRATIAKIDNACMHDENSVTVDLKIAFEGLLGPRGRTNATDKPYFAYPFFVAVASASGDILAKEIFAANMTYEQGQNRQTYYEGMRQIIPVEARDRGNRYKILIGFQLGPEQLAYNRKRIKQAPIFAEPTLNKPTPLTTPRY